MSPTRRITVIDVIQTHYLRIQFAKQQRIHRLLCDKLSTLQFSNVFKYLFTEEILCVIM